VQIVTGHRGTVASETAKVEIVPVLPAGNPTLRDIRELERTPGPGALPLVVLGAGLVALAAVLLRRRRAPRGRPTEAPLPVAPPPVPRDAYGLALDRLAAIEREPQEGHASVSARYERVADVLRDYLEAAEDIPARERTTSELLWAMPPRLTEGGLRRLTGEVLGEADLVKFARRRPDPAAATAYVGQARELLRRWHAAASTREPADADALR
jgi:hypothetical protein